MHHYWTPYSQTFNCHFECFESSSWKGGLHLDAYLVIRWSALGPYCIPMAYITLTDKMIPFQSHSLAVVAWSNVPGPWTHPYTTLCVCSVLDPSTLLCIPLFLLMSPLGPWCQTSWFWIEESLLFRIENLKSSFRNIPSWFGPLSHLCLITLGTLVSHIS